MPAKFREVYDCDGYKYVETTSKSSCSFLLKEIKIYLEYFLEVLHFTSWLFWDITTPVALFLSRNVIPISH